MPVCSLLKGSWRKLGSNTARGLALLALLHALTTILFLDAIKTDDRGPMIAAQGAVMFVFMGAVLLLTIPPFRRYSQKGASTASRVLVLSLLVQASLALITTPWGLANGATLKFALGDAAQSLVLPSMLVLTYRSIRTFEQADALAAFVLVALGIQVFPEVVALPSVFSGNTARITAVHWQYVPSLIVGAIFLSRHTRSLYKKALLACLVVLLLLVVSASGFRTSFGLLFFLLLVMAPMMWPHTGRTLRSRNQVRGGIVVVAVVVALVAATAADQLPFSRPLERGLSVVDVSPSTASTDQSSANRLIEARSALTRLAENPWLPIVGLGSGVGIPTQSLSIYSDIGIQNGEKHYIHIPYVAYFYRWGLLGFFSLVCMFTSSLILARRQMSSGTPCLGRLWPISMVLTAFVVSPAFSFVPGDFFLGIALGLLLVLDQMPQRRHSSRMYGLHKDLCGTEHRSRWRSERALGP